MDTRPTLKRDELTRDIGYRLLGPVVHRWLLGLDQYVSYFDDGSTRFLYCARAGGRIARLYELYLKGQGRTLSDDHKMFWVSRMALCKGTFKRNPTRANQVIASEYYHQTVSHAVRGLMRNCPKENLKSILAGSELETAGHEFDRWVSSRSSSAQAVRKYLDSSSTAFHTYFKGLMGDAERAVLIDSGWQGTSQSILTRAYRNIDWKGLYVGRILTPHHDTHIVDNIIGLLFQSETYKPETPETAIVTHRHLFETLLETNGPSIEEIRGGPNAKIAEQQIALNEADDAVAEKDALFLHVMEYLEDHAASSLSQIMARHQNAMPELARILVHPGADETNAIQCKARSADFGRDILVPVLNQNADEQERSAPEQDADHRIQTALWTQGQIALEFDGETARHLQNRAAGLLDDHDYFDPHATSDKSENTDLAKISIITRTKNRPILLERAAMSVAAQSYTNFEWIVVNDGGDISAVRKVLDNCAVDRRNILLVSNAKSLGMEAASNAGIAQAKGEYLLIHDDDDSLHPDFLKTTVDYLQSKAGQRYGGVVTGSSYISEEINGNYVIEHGRVPYMNWVQNIQISEMLAQNLFPPIAFVFRRTVYDEIGGYNEDLPVLGDWYFNLEFLLKSDIRVLPDMLANYHHRNRGDSSRTGVYSNSVIGGLSKHEEFASVARNAFMRKYDSSALAAGAIQAYFANDVRNRLDPISKNHPPHDKSTALWAEIDRLWVAAHLARHNPVIRGVKGTGKSSDDPQRSLTELMKIAYKIRLKIPTHPSFDEAIYLQAHHDVAQAVQQGDLWSGYQHYLMYGRLEGRLRPLTD